MRALKSPFAFLLSALTALAVVASLGAISPAQANAVDIRLLSPYPGTNLPAGAAGEEFWLDTSASEPGRGYDFVLQCYDRSGYQDLWSRTHFFSNGNNVLVRVADALPSSGSRCSAALTPDDPNEFAADLGQWDVADTLTLSDVRASASYFYPRVRDGFRDNVDVSWFVQNEDYPRDVHLSVLNAGGDYVRTATSSSGSWRWDGRYDSGSLVPAGNYRIIVALMEPSPGAPPQEVTIPVAVRTDVVTQRKTVTKLGHQSSVAATRSCQASRDPDWNKSTMLDCWGGKYALAKYRFTIPASAYSVTWGLRNVTTGADLCCSGRITKSGVRSSSKTMFTVTGKVTGWRAMDIRKASVTYTARVRR